jgi:hypothetical protein
VVLRERTRKLVPSLTVVGSGQAREPDAWPGEQGLVEHARHLAVSMRDLAGIDIRIDTDGREAVDVAVELREALRPYGLAV